MTIDVVQALDLLEICADEAPDGESSASTSRCVVQGRPTLATMALAKLQLDITALAKAPRRGPSGRTTASQDAALTLGAHIVFRTAHRFGRAGASTARTLEAAYRAVQRYVEVLPDSLRDDADMAAIAGRLRSPYRFGPTRTDARGAPSVR